MNSSITLSPMVPAPAFANTSKQKKKKEAERETAMEFMKTGAGVAVTSLMHPYALLVDMAEVATNLFEYMRNNALTNMFERATSSINNGNILGSIENFFSKMMRVNPSASVINLNASNISTKESKHALEASASTSSSIKMKR